MKRIGDYTIYLKKLKVDKGAVCLFSYSIDGKNFENAANNLLLQPKVDGAKVGIFCTQILKNNDSGYADFDRFRIEAVENNF